MNIKFADNVGEKSDKHEENVEGTSPLKEILINFSASPTPSKKLFLLNKSGKNFNDIFQKLQKT